MLWFAKRMWIYCGLRRAHNYCDVRDPIIEPSKCKLNKGNKMMSIENAASLGKYAIDYSYCNNWSLKP